MKPSPPKARPLTARQKVTLAQVEAADGVRIYPEMLGGGGYASLGRVANNLTPAGTFLSTPGRLLRRICEQLLDRGALEIAKSGAPRSPFHNGPDEAVVAPAFRSKPVGVNATVASRRSLPGGRADRRGGG